MVESSRSAALDYTYEASVRQGTAVEDVLAGLRASLARWLGNQLMECDGAGDEDRGGARRRRRAPRDARASARRARSAGLDVVGLDVAEAVREGGRGCAYFVGAAAVEGAACHVVDGGMTLYLGKHDAGRVRTRALAASRFDAERFREETTLDAGRVRTRTLAKSTVDLERWKEETTEQALGVLRDAMNAGASPFLEGSEEEEYAVPGLLGLRYIAGRARGGGATTVGAATRGAAARSATMETLGASLLVVGLGTLAVLALALVVVRKRRRADAYSAFRDDDPGEGSDKGTADDLSTVSLAPRTGKAAYVVGQEGSLYTDATRGARAVDASFDTGESGNGNGDDQQVDVHHCTSATCLICHGKPTTFVNAFEDEDGAGSEGYELGYDRHASSSHSSYERASKNEGQRPPAFHNPARIARPYVVEDTVQF